MNTTYSLLPLYFWVDSDVVFKKKVITVKTHRTTNNSCNNRNLWNMVTDKLHEIGVL